MNVNGNGLVGTTLNPNAEIPKPRMLNPKTGLIIAYSALRPLDGESFLDHDSSYLRYQISYKEPAV